MYAAVNDVAGLAARPGIGDSDGVFGGLSWPV
jgi:hypothetical protein